MNDSNFLELRRVLREPEQFDTGSLLLFLPEHEKWTPDTKGMLLEPLDIPHENLKNEDDDIPPIAKEHGLIPTLGIWEIVSIRDGVLHYIDPPSEAHFLQAFVYFWENDAYLDFGNSGQR